MGYGAIARANIDSNPNSSTFGQITSVDIISEGENYPVGNDASDVISSDNISVGVVDTIIANSGSGYEDATVTDSNGLEYNVTIGNGRIISAQPINNIAITNKPNIVIESLTGSGALIKPIIKELSLDPQGEIVQVIDCVGPETNLVVGFINGQPYYGDYHVMPDGTKMTGVSHSDNDKIIYDTPQQSLNKITNVNMTTTMTQPSTTITPSEPITDTTPSAPIIDNTTPPSDPPSDSPSGGGGYGGY